MSLQIGGVIFKRKQYESISNIFNTDRKVMRNLIRCSQWQIQHNQFRTDKWNILFPIMQQSIVQKMDLKLTYYSPILTFIAHIRFPNLMHLNLEVNQIRSIDPLASLQAPILEKLVLSNNRIVSLKPLYKMNCKYLKTLLLDGNEIKDFSPLTRVNFPKGMQKMAFQNWEQRKMQTQSIIFFFKMTPNSLKVGSLLCQRKDRIKCDRHLEMMRQKYKKISLS